MVRLMDGRRIFRVSNPQSELCLELPVDPTKPVRQQTYNLVEALNTLREFPLDSVSATARVAET